MSLLATPSLRLPPTVLAGANRYARPAVLVLLTVFIAWRLATLTWLFVPGAQAPATAPLPAPTAGSGAGKSTAVNTSALAELHLFGHAEQVVDKPIVAPTTDLALTLRGVWAFPEGDKRASAIIEASGEQNVYFVGERLPGGANASLKQVLPDRVILDRGGRLETLYLVQDGDASSISLVPESAGPAPKNAVDKTGDKALQRSLRDMREKLRSNPLSLMKLISAQPAKDESGQIIGFRVSPGADPALFGRAGLQKNDIITAVNGVSLADPTQLPMLMEQVKNAENLNIRVRRGNDEVALLLSLGGDSQAKRPMAPPSLPRPMPNTQQPNYNRPYSPQNNNPNPASLQ